MTSELKISRIFHAGYIFASANVQIAFDPIFENPFSHNCNVFPPVHIDTAAISQIPCSAVFISHHHDDHCSLESLNFLDRQTPIYIYCLHEELFSLIRELGFCNVHSLQLQTPVLVDGFKIIPLSALDEDVDCVFHIQYDDLNILNVVDSWLHPSTFTYLSSFAPWDLVLWPFQTMREVDVLSPRRALPASRELPPEWLEQLQFLQPRYVVPSSCQFNHESWSWYNQALFPITYHQFKKEVETELPQTQVLRLNPGVSVALGKKSLGTSSPISWIHPLGDQNVDYTYDPHVTPPSPAEIARHFSPLTEGQSKRVHDYCRSELPAKYRKLQFIENSYFAKPRLWKLTLYDHRQQEQSFLYHIEGLQMELVSHSSASLAWLTEVPISKLYNAIEKGETLTSMYLRINDFAFEDPIETEIQLADTLEDPLIRSLFEGVFATYQKEQLKKIMLQKTKF